MASANPSAANDSRTASTPVFLATLAAVFLVIGLLLALDLFLARAVQQASEAHASAEYELGRTLLASGHASDAAERFGTAVAIDRGNVSYSLALAEATLEQGRLTDAEATLRDLLGRVENDGAVNLTMAHVLVREKRVEQSKAYFHRAIFGRWGADSLARRISARLELIDLLVKQGATGELLAEVLPLEDLAPDSVEFRLRLGRLFMIAGSPGRSATTFRALLRRDPNSAEAYAGLGRAALDLGNLQTAHADLAAAARLRPTDAGIENSLIAVDSVIALDPSARGIDARERATRGQVLLVRTLAALNGCLDAGVTAASDSARAMLSTPATAGQENDRADAMVAVAENLWSAKEAGCAAAGRDSVLRWVHIRLTQ
jgi:tetratricopeptide (TPR) repeat protein